MIERADEAASGTPSAAPDELPYRIELWQEADGAAPERVLARACSATLAQAIYRAAQTEHPGRRITLSQGGRLIADSEG